MSRSTGGDERQPARRGRRLLLVLLLVAAAVPVLVRSLLAFFAADFFLAVARQAAHGSGLEIRLEGEPSATLAGFEAGPVSLVDAQGAEVLRAGAVSGTIEYLLHRPWIGLSLALEDAQMSWSTPPPERAPGKAEGPLVPDLPPQLSSLSVERARVDFGGGRTLELDAGLKFEGGIVAELRRVDYHDPSAGLAAEALAGTARIERAQTRAPAHATAPSDDAWTIDLALHSGSALAGPVLLDLGAHALLASGRLERDQAGTLSISGAAVQLGRLLRASGDVRLEPDGTISRADGKLATESLAEAFDTLVREPFAGVVPPLAEAVVGGRAELALGFEAPSRAAVFATLSVSSPALRAPGVEAERLEAVLPWSGPAVAARPRDGALRAGRLSLFGLWWTGVQAPLAATPGRLRATAPQDWKSEAGTLRLAELELLGEPAGLRLEAVVDRLDLDLARLGAAVDADGLDGRVTSGRSRLRLDADALRSDAIVVANTFGGRIELSNLFVEHPFRRVPELGLDARLEEIDLASLTSWLGMGRVTGVLEGSVRGLVLADGQPQALDADLHTVERRGVPQYVDVRAIQQLGVLGGGDSGSLTGKLLRFVDRYRYAKLGLRCRLRNDVFELRGVETDAGRDYIIKGSLLPPSVSVVSHSQVVSFSEMLRRVRRITAVDEGGIPNAEP